MFWKLLSTSSCLWTSKWHIILEQLLYREKNLIYWVKEEERNKQGGNKHFPTICSLNSKSTINFLAQIHSFPPPASFLIIVCIIKTGNMPPFFSQHLYLGMLTNTTSSVKHRKTNANYNCSTASNFSHVWLYFSVHVRTHTHTVNIYIKYHLICYF